MIEKVKLTEIRMTTKTIYMTSIITKTTSTTKTLTETKTKYQTQITRVLEENLSVTLMALITAVIMGLCLLTTLTLFIRKKKNESR